MNPSLNQQEDFSQSLSSGIDEYSKNFIIRF